MLESFFSHLRPLSGLSGLWDPGCWANIPGDWKEISVTVSPEADPWLSALGLLGVLSSVEEELQDDLFPWSFAPLGLKIYLPTHSLAEVEDLLAQVPRLLEKALGLRVSLGLGILRDLVPSPPAVCRHEVCPGIYRPLVLEPAPEQERSPSPWTPGGRESNLRITRVERPFKPLEIPSPGMSTLVLKPGSRTRRLEDFWETLRGLDIPPPGVLPSEDLRLVWSAGPQGSGPARKLRNPHAGFLEQGLKRLVAQLLAGVSGFSHLTGMPLPGTLNPKNLRRILADRTPLWGTARSTLWIHYFAPLPPAFLTKLTEAASDQALEFDLTSATRVQIVGWGDGNPGGRHYHLVPENLRTRRS